MYKQTMAAPEDDDVNDDAGGPKRIVLSMAVLVGVGTYSLCLGVDDILSYRSLRRGDLEIAGASSSKCLYLRVKLGEHAFNKVQK